MDEGNNNNDSEQKPKRTPEETRNRYLDMVTCPPIIGP